MIGIYFRFARGLNFKRDSPFTHNGLHEYCYRRRACKAEAIGITTQAMEKHLSNLKAEGKIIRIGPDKGGYWEVQNR